MIDIQTVSHQIDGQPILNEVSLQVNKGGVVALIGPNGAGKSTLLSLIARLLPLQAGAIRIDDLQIGTASDNALAQTLAILPQDLSVASRLTIRDLVGFGRYPYHRGHPTSADNDIIEATLALFDLSDLANRQLETLSGGQRQRAFVAMAYAQDTDYLLLDEPLNNLDIAASRALMAILQDMAIRRGRTVVIVLHDINYAAAYADRVIALKNGAVVADGTPETVVTEDLLSNVFQTPARVRIIDGRPLVLV